MFLYTYRLITRLKIVVDFKITMYISEGGKNQVVNVKRTASLTATLLLLLSFYNAGLVGILVCHFTLHKLDMKIRNYEKDRQNTIKYSEGTTKNVLKKRKNFNTTKKL